MLDRSGKQLHHGYLAIFYGMLACWFAFNLWSGLSSRLTNPRYEPFAWFLLALAILMVPINLKAYSKIGFKVRHMTALVIISIPMILGMVIAGLPASMETTVSEVSFGAPPASPLDAGVNDLSDVVDPDAAMDKYELLIEDGVIKIPKDRFVPSIEEIHKHMDSYEGMKIQMDGVVYRLPEFNQDELVVSRLLMTCCAADVSAVGLLCEFAGGESFVTDSWIRVEGKIEIKDHGGVRIPVIKAESIVAIEGESDPYIYSEQ